MRQGNRISVKNGLTGIEGGHIYFFYHPRECQPRSVNDVRMLYCVLHPFDSRSYRLLTIDNKQLPSSNNETNYTVGHVTRVDGKEAVIHYLMSGTGDRHSFSTRVQLAPVRQCGEGIYSIAIKESSTFLVYLLETPKEEREIATQFGIKCESYFALGIQNPWHKAAGRDDVLPAVPESLRSSFDGDKIIYTMIPLLLNYERMQVIFIRTDVFVGELLNHRACDINTFDELLDELELQKEKYPVVSIFKK